MLQTILASDCITYDASYDLVFAASSRWPRPRGFAVFYGYRVLIVFFLLTVYSVCSFSIWYC